MFADSKALIEAAAKGLAERQKGRKEGAKCVLFASSMVSMKPA